MLLEPAEFLVKGKVFLDEKQPSELLHLLKGDENTENIKECGWELISIICRNIDASTAEEQEVLKECFHSILKKASIKEVILGLNESLAAYQSLNVFQILLPICSSALLKLSGKQSKHYEETFEHILDQVKTILQDEEVEETEHGNTVNELVIEQVYKTMCQFLTGIISKWSKETQNKTQIVSGSKTNELEAILCRDMVLKFIFDFIGATADKVIKLDNQEILQQPILFIFDLNNFSDLMDVQRTDERDLNPVGVVIYLRCLIISNMLPIQLPCVFSAKSMFNMAVVHLSLSLKRTNENIVQANLELLSFLLARLKKNSLSSKESVSHNYLKLAQGLTNVMVWSQTQIHREKSRDIFTDFIQKFDQPSCYCLLCDLYRISDHSGLCGFIIKMISDTLQHLHVENKLDISNDIAEMALEFIKVIPSETNVLQESDRLMAGLNFIRLWLLKDCKDHLTGIWNKVRNVETNLNLILQCSDVSRVEFKKVATDLEGQFSSTIDDVIQLIVPGGIENSSLSKEQKKKVIETAYLNLDMMASVISRINEIIRDNG